MAHGLWRTPNSKCYATMTGMTRELTLVVDPTTRPRSAVLVLLEHLGHPENALISCKTEILYEMYVL